MAAQLCVWSVYGVHFRWSAIICVWNLSWVLADGCRKLTLASTSLADIMIRAFGAFYVYCKIGSCFKQWDMSIRLVTYALEWIMRWYVVMGSYFAKKSVLDINLCRGILSLACCCIASSSNGWNDIPQKNYSVIKAGVSKGLICHDPYLGFGKRYHWARELA